MKVLVTGATGVVGRRLVPLLVGSGHLVAAAGRSPDGRDRLVRMGATVIKADLLSPDSLRRAVAGCAAIVNLATHMPASPARMMLPGAWTETTSCAVSVRPTWSTRPSRREWTASSRNRSPRCTRTAAIGGSRRHADPAPATTARSKTRSVRRRASRRRAAPASFCDSAPSTAGLEAPRGRRPPCGAGRSRCPGARERLSSVSHDDAATAAAAALGVESGVYNVVDDEPVTRREYFDSLAKVLGVPPPKYPPHWMGLLFGSVGELLARSQRVRTGS